MSRSRPGPRSARDDGYHHGDLRPSLLQAGLDLLAEKGFEGLTLREVARRAGVSQAAPYHHFAGRAALVAAMIEQGYLDFTAHVQATAESCGSDDPLERLIVMGVAYVRFAVERPALFRLLFRPQLWGDDVPDGHPARLAGASAYQVLLDQTAAACAGGLVQGPVEMAALAAWSIMHGLAMLIIDGTVEGLFADSPDVLAETLSRALARGFSN